MKIEDEEVGSYGGGNGEARGVVLNQGNASPNPNENWPHELSIARLLCDQLEGPLPDRLTQLDEWDWLTGYRGFTSEGGAISGLSTAPGDIRALTPDSVVTHPARPERLFIEYDRGTKRLVRPRTHSKYRDSISATLEAYDRLLNYHYARFFAVGRPGLVLFVVRDTDRREAILELARKNINFPLRVRVAEGVRIWFQDWLTGKDKMAAPAAPAEDRDRARSEYVLKLEQATQDLRQLVGKAEETFLAMRKAGIAWQLPSEWEKRLEGRGEAKVTNG